MIESQLLKELAFFWLLPSHKKSGLPKSRYLIHYIQKIPPITTVLKFDKLKLGTPLKHIATIRLFLQ